MIRIMTLTRDQITSLTTHELCQLASRANAELALRLLPPAPDNKDSAKMEPGERLALLQFGRRHGDSLEKAVKDLYANLEHDVLDRMERVFAERDAEKARERQQLATEIADAFRASAPPRPKGSVVAPVKPVTKKGVQYLVCEGCGETWSRPAKRGRAPSKCAACA